MEPRFRIDLMETEGDGEFPCPTCGMTISPDDYSEMTYHVLKVKTKPDGTIEEIYIQCGKCGSTICIVGFSTLQDQCSSNDLFAIEIDFSFQADLRTT